MTDVTLAELADHESRDGHIIRPGAYFVSHGGGYPGHVIRAVTQSWAGHAGVYVGNGRIVEGRPPVSAITSVNDHPDAIWNIHENLTDAQRLEIVAQAYALVGVGYDWEAYLGFVLEFTHLRDGRTLDARFKLNSHRVCSALVDSCYSAGGVDLKPSASVSNLVTPDDLYRRLINMGVGA